MSRAAGEERRVAAVVADRDSTGATIRVERALRRQADEIRSGRLHVAGEHVAVAVPEEVRVVWGQVGRP